MKSGVASGRHLSERDRAEVLRRVLAGGRVVEVAREFACAPSTVYGICDGTGNSRRKPLEWCDHPRRLSAREREEIRAGLAAGLSFRKIALGIDRETSTVSREVARNGGRKRYVAVRAHRRAFRKARRPKRSKLEMHPGLCRRVIDHLKNDYSPEQIAGRLKMDFPDDETMRISPEAIYQSIYIQARGTLRKDLTRHLRTGRTKRKKQGTSGRRGQIPGKVMISERPAEADDRAVPGHWEGDLIVGKDGRSFVGTLVERQTRFVMLVYLGRDKTTETVTAKIGEKICDLPGQLKRTLTWDQGKEMTGHLKFTEKTGLQIYFCDPHSPWQRGSNENTNGLLRQYLPKGADLAEFGQVDLDQIAAKLNNRPRKTHNFYTPSEKMDELLR